MTGETVSTTNPHIGNAIGQSIDTDPLETQTDDNHLDTSLDETPPTHANKPTFSDGVIHIIMHDLTVGETSVGQLYLSQPPLPQQQTKSSVQSSKLPYYQLWN